MARGSIPLSAHTFGISSRRFCGENQANRIKDEEPLQQGNGIKNSKFLGSRQTVVLSFWDQDDKFLGSDRKCLLASLKGRDWN